MTEHLVIDGRNFVGSPGQTPAVKTHTLGGEHFCIIDIVRVCGIAHDSETVTRPALVVVAQKIDFVSMTDLVDKTSVATTTSGVDEIN